MDKKTVRQDNAGMSLVEIIAAVSIFMVLALILFRGFVSSSRLNKVGNVSFCDNNRTKYYGRDKSKDICTDRTCF